MTFLRQDNRLFFYTVVCAGLENKGLSPPFYNTFYPSNCSKSERFDERCTYLGMIWLTPRAYPARSILAREHLRAMHRCTRRTFAYFYACIVKRMSRERFWQKWQQYRAHNVHTLICIYLFHPVWYIPSFKICGVLRAQFIYTVGTFLGHYCCDIGLQNFFRAHRWKKILDPRLIGKLTVTKKNKNIKNCKT